MVFCGIRLQTQLYLVKVRARSLEVRHSIRSTEFTFFSFFSPVKVLWCIIVEAIQKKNTFNVKCLHLQKSRGSCRILFVSIVTSSDPGSTVIVILFQTTVKLPMTAQNHRQEQNKVITGIKKDLQNHCICCDNYPPVFIHASSSHIFPYLSHNLIGTLYQNLHWPPIIISHTIQKPLQKIHTLLVLFQT